MREIKPITIGRKRNAYAFYYGLYDHKSTMEREMEMNTFFECIVAIGLFIIIGTAGSTDINAISLTQTIIYALIGLATMFIGVAGCKGNKKER